MVNKLAFDLTEQELEKAFEPIGSVADVEIVKDETTQRSEGHGSIVFQDAQHARRASIEMQGLVLHNLPIRLQVKSEARYKSLEERSYEVLFIKNLPYDATESELMTIFAPFHALRCGLGRAPMTEKNLGYGYVRFSSKEAALKALKGARGKEIDGRTLKVSFARPKPGNYDYIV